MDSSSLQAELKKRQPFTSTAEEAILNILRTADQLQLRFDRFFRQFGLTPSQYNVLRILRGEGGPLPVLEIASRTITMVPGITGLVDRLEQAGLVQRERSTTDRRVIYVKITESAQRLLADMDAPLRELHERLVGDLDIAAQRRLTTLLEGLRGSLPSPP